MKGLPTADRFASPSVAEVPPAVAAAIGLRALRAGIGAPGKRAAQLVPELIIAGIGIVWSLVLAVGVWIELSAVECRHGCSPWNKSACRSNAPSPRSLVFNGRNSCS